MATIREVKNLVSNFEQSQEKIMNDCITNTSDLILDENRAQMIEGLYKEGNPILPKYKPFTRKMKSEQGRDPNKVTLYDEGDFHREMFLKVETKEIITNSKDQKTNELLRKYNKEGNIFGIPFDKKEIINESIMDKFIKIFRLMTKL